MLDSNDCASVGTESNGEFDFNRFGYILLQIQKCDLLLRIVLKANKNVTSSNNNVKYPNM